MGVMKGCLRMFSAWSKKCWRRNNVHMYRGGAPLHRLNLRSACHRSRYRFSSIARLFEETPNCFSFFFFIIMPDLLALFWLINLPSLPPSSTRRKKEHYTIITSSFYAPFNFFFSGFFSNLYRCFPPWQAGVSSQNAISSIGALSVLAFFFFSRHPLLKRYEFHVNMVLSACALADEK